MKIIFTDQRDVGESVGKLTFGASVLRRVAPADGLQHMRTRCAVPRDDGGYDLYGTSPEKGHWQRIFRATTHDGVHYQDQQCVFEVHREQRWLGEADMAWSPPQQRMLAIFFGPGRRWHEAYAFASDAGGSWRQLGAQPVYQDHDALGLTWHPGEGRYLIHQTTYQPWPRRFSDNIGAHARRVLMIISSTDGVQWDHDVPVTLKEGPYVPAERLITPDQDDPPDLEFYRLTAFPYAGRWAGMMLNYAASPDAVNPNYPPSRHGPMLGAEWWISDDGRQWRRPYRGIFAAGEADAAVMHEPMTLGGWHLWVIGTQVFGVPEDCLFFVGSLCHSEFSTHLLTLPATPLRLRAQLGPEAATPRGFGNQSFVMTELRDEHDAVIAGFERDHCTFQRSGEIHQVMKWREADTSALAGRQVRLRFYLRDARIYAVTTGCANFCGQG